MGIVHNLSSSCQNIQRSLLAGSAHTHTHTSHACDQHNATPLPMFTRSWMLLCIRYLRERARATHAKLFQTLEVHKKVRKMLVDVNNPERVLADYLIKLSLGTKVGIHKSIAKCNLLMWFTACSDHVFDDVQFSILLNVLHADAPFEMQFFFLNFFWAQTTSFELMLCLQCLFPLLVLQWCSWGFVGTLWPHFQMWFQVQQSTFGQRRINSKGGQWNAAL